jgi:hypothetical protein
VRHDPQVKVKAEHEAETTEIGYAIVNNDILAMMRFDSSV